MQTPNLFRKLAHSCAILTGLAALTIGLHAQTAPTTTGSVTGRVLNATNDRYLFEAHITVEGSQQDVLTDNAGYYHLYGLPAGEVKIHAFYTGLPEKVITVTVPAGGTVTEDINLAPLSGADTGMGTGTGVVKLDAFTVAADRDTDQKSIAINEQRFAPNMKSVVSTDQFGDVTEGNVGEFLKYMPGVSLEYTSPDARQIILRGINPIYTAVFVDGNRMASAASSGSNRFFELEQASINNVSRIEVVFSRTPELDADALGGSVNMISKSAFESLHASLKYRVYLSLNKDDLTLNKTPGPGDDSTHKSRAGFDLTLTEPVNRHFGFTVSYLNSNIYYPQHRSQPTWTPISNGAGGTIANPFMRQYQMQDGPKTNERQSIGLTMDFKSSDNNTFSVRPQWNYYNAFFGNRNINFNVQGTSNTAPLSWSPDFVNSAVGAGSTSFGTSFRRKYGYTGQIDGIFRHTGEIFNYDLGTSYSHATNHYHDAQDGHFESIGLTRGNLTEKFSGITANEAANKPSLIQTFDKSTGAIVDWTQLGNYNIQSAGFNEADSEDVYKQVHGDVSAKMNWKLPTTFTVGVKLQDHLRDIRKPTVAFTFVGPDGKASTASIPDPDDSAALYPVVYDSVNSQITPPFNFPKIQWPSTYGMYQLYKAHPEYFSLNASTISNSAKNSQYFTELISAAYLQGDTKAIDGRLRLVYGLRFERTFDQAYGYLQDQNAIYQHDAAGHLLLVNNAPVPLLAPNGLPYTDASNALALATLEYKERALHNSKQYANGYPTVSATYNILPNLIGRLAYSKAVGRPDLANIIPGTSLPDPSSGVYAIGVNNSNLQAEQANNYDASLEYYFSKVGLLSLSVFRKDISNFYGSVTVPATAALLTQYDIPNADYYLQNSATIKTNFNVGTARVTGIQLDYKQGLDFLPVQGFSLFSSGYAVHLHGSPLADFSNFISKAWNAGLGYQNRRFSSKLNFNYRGTQRYGLTQYTDSAGTKVNGYEYFKPRGQFDMDFEYKFFRFASVFLTGRNITDVVQDDQRYSPEMLPVMHLYRREEFGAQYTVGVKGTF
jgi:iron complex outermembrane receptor protein